MTSNTILHIIRKENCALFAYLDFIIMSHEEDAERHLNMCSDPFVELGLPMNRDKCSSPSRLLHTLALLSIWLGTH